MRIDKVSEQTALIFGSHVNLRDLFESMLQSMELSFECSNDRQQSKKLIYSKHYSIFISYLPDCQEADLQILAELKTLYHKPKILAIADWQNQLGVQKLIEFGIVDILYEPLHPQLFKNVLNRLLEAAAYRPETRDTASRLVRDSIHKDSVYHLKTSLSQGNGMGSMVSLIDILEMSPLTDEGDYKVDRELVELLVENNKFSRKVLEDLHFTVDFINEELRYRLYSAEYILQKCQEKISSLSAIFQQKGLASEEDWRVDGREQISLDEEKFLLIFEELLINALKYSLRGSCITISAAITQDNLYLKVKNLLADTEMGIPNELSQVVLEPFFRIPPPVEDVWQIERFSLGLGLTAVKHVVEKHKGRLSISSPEQQTGENKSVVCEIYIPIVQQ
ncbi:MAG: ATP-binding protein [Spirochaetota bacterium]